MPETDVVELSAEEIEKKGKNKRPGKKKGKVSKKVENTKSKKKSSVGNRKRPQGPCAQDRSVESVIMQDVDDSLRKQSVLTGRFFDMGIINLQSWLHLFNTKSHILYEEEVRKFYYNVQFKENGSILTRVNNIDVHLDESLLSKILKVPREGTQFVLGRTSPTDFPSLISKIPTTKVVGIYKKDHEERVTVSLRVHQQSSPSSH